MEPRRESRRRLRVRTDHPSAARSVCEVVKTDIRLAGCKGRKELIMEKCGVYYSVVEEGLMKRDLWRIYGMWVWEGLVKRDIWHLLHSGSEYHEVLLFGST